MRLQEFLTEAPAAPTAAPVQPVGSPVIDQGIEDLKAILSLKIKELPVDAATSKALQEIEELLSHVNAGGRMGIVQGELAKIEDPSVRSAQKLLAKYVLALNATPQQRQEMFAMWQDDKLIDINVLLGVGKHAIKDIVSGYSSNPAIEELANDLFSIAALGQGKGEFALSVMSKRINKRSQTEGGDLLVAGRKVEVKTKDAGAARFYDQNVRPSQQWAATVEAFKTKYAEIMKGMGFTAPTGLNLTHLMKIATSLQPEQQQEIRKDIHAVISNVFPGMDVNNIVDFAVVGDMNSAKAAYANVNFDYYMSQKDDDGVLYINLAPGKDKQGKDIQSWMVFFKNASELTRSGLRLHADTAYPISNDPRNAYPQMSIVTSKQIPTDNIA